MPEEKLRRFCNCKRRNKMSDAIDLTIPPATGVDITPIIEHRKGVVLVSNATAEPVVVRLEKTDAESNQWVLTVMSGS